MKRSPVYALVPLLIAAVLAASPTTAQESRGQASGEAIQIHGSWTIEVYDGDRLVERREFENDLAASGAAFLVSLLGTDLTSGSVHPMIYLEDDLCPSGEPTDFILIARSDYNPDQLGTQSVCAVPTLTTTIAADLDVLGNNSLTLEGEFPAGLDGSLSMVGTALAWKSTGSPGLFTRHSLTPIDVLEGQEVRITVVLTFG